jgi:hypothetical protein
MAGAVTPAFPAHFQIKFDSYWRSNIAQQKNHRLEGCYEIQMVDGASFRGDIDGSQAYAMREIQARAGKTEPSDIPNQFYWVRPRGFDKTTWIDQFDSIGLGQLGEPTSMVSRNHAIAANRQNDLILIAALGGTRYVGPNGNIAQVLPTTGGPTGTGQVVGVQFGSASTNSGLQLAKLTQAAFILDQNEIERMERYFGYTAKELNNLLTNVDQVDSVLYNDVRALVDGDLRRFMGFTFKMSQLFTFSTGSTTVRQCYAWQKSALVMGVGRDVMSTVDRLPQQSNAVQVYTCMLKDSTRKQDEGVVQILCDESV